MPPALVVVGATSAALVCFALNSLLCRVALRSGSIDPASFAAVRFGSGALALVLLLRTSGRAARGGSWAAAATLSAYGVLFSLACLQLAAGTGALILSGSLTHSDAAPNIRHIVVEPGKAIIEILN